MKFVAQKGPRMGDAIQGICGAISVSSGFRTLQSFLYQLGILKVPHRELNDYLMKDNAANISNEESSEHVHFLAKGEMIKNVERVLGYSFRCKSYLVQALSHKSYVEAIAKKNDSRIELQDYNLLEYLGDSIFNFFVLDFFLKNSEKYKDDYPPNMLHKLQVETVNNCFLSLIMIDSGLHKAILRDKNHPQS